MAKLHNQLDYAAKFQRGIRLITGVGDEAEGMVRLSETWQPTVDPFARADWATLMGERICIGSQTQGAVAGQFAAVGLRNPVGSTVNLLVFQAEVFGLIQLQYQLRCRPFSVVGVTSISSCFNRDSRVGAFGGLGGQGLLLTGSNAVGANFGNGPIWTQRTNGVQSRFDVPLVISPGFEIFWVSTTVNNLLNGSYAWIEAQRLPGL